MFFALSALNTGISTQVGATLERGSAIAARAGLQNPISLFKSHKMNNQFVSLSGLSEDHHKPAKTLTLHWNRADSAGKLHRAASVVCECKDSPLPWQERGLMYTATGYGRKIPTRQMIKVNGKWRRVYCCIFSNIGTCYIGNLFAKTGTIYTVTD